MTIFGRPRYKARPRIVRPGERVRDADHDMRVLEGTPQERFQAFLPNVPKLNDTELVTALSTEKDPARRAALDAEARARVAAQGPGAMHANDPQAQRLARNAAALRANPDEAVIAALSDADQAKVRAGGAGLAGTPEREHYLSTVAEGIRDGKTVDAAIANAHALPLDPFEGLAFDPSTDADTDSERYWDAVERYMNAKTPLEETQADADMRAAAKQIMDRAEADGPGSPHADLMARLDLRRPELVTAGGRVRTPSVLDPNPQRDPALAAMTDFELSHAWVAAMEAGDVPRASEIEDEQNYRVRPFSGRGSPTPLSPNVDAEVAVAPDVAAAASALATIAGHGGSSLEIAYTPAVVTQLTDAGLVRKRGPNLVLTDAGFNAVDAAGVTVGAKPTPSRGGALPGAPTATLPQGRVFRNHKGQWVVSYRTGDMIHNERLQVAKTADAEEAMQAAIDAGWGDKVDFTTPTTVASAGTDAAVNPQFDTHYNNNGELQNPPPGFVQGEGTDLNEGDQIVDNEGTVRTISDLSYGVDAGETYIDVRFTDGDGMTVNERGGTAWGGYDIWYKPAETVQGPHPAMGSAALLPNTVLPTGTAAPIDPADLLTILADDDRFTAMGPKEQTEVAKALGALRTPPSLDQIDAWLDNVTRSLGNGVDIDEANRRAKYRHKTGTAGGTPVGGAPPAPPAGPPTPQPTFPAVVVPSDMAGVQSLVASLKGEFATASSGREYFTHDPGSGDPSTEALHREETLRAIGSGIDNLVLADPVVAKAISDSDDARKAFAKSQSDADRKTYWAASGTAARAYATATRDLLAQIRPMGKGGDDTITPNWKLEAGNTDLAASVDTALEYYPTEWITTAGQWNLKVQSSHNGGTKAQGWFREEGPQQGQVYLSNPKKSATAVHELGHLMERNRRALAQAEWVFLHRRSKGKGVQPIPKYGTSGYTNDFMDEYIGATYLAPGVPGYRAKNFEAFTRGMEWVSGLGRMMRTSKPDPDYRAFMVGVLAVM